MAAQLTFDSDVFRSFAFYATICVVKMMLMSLYTARFRIGKKVFENPEDCKGQKRDGRPVQISKDEDVERVRRNHQNDIENIIPFVLLGFVYVLTGPAVSAALTHFRVFTASRIIHTLAYQIPIPQPSRAFSFLVGLIINMSMAVQIIIYAA
ncbi:microsomal glutathione S-transferase 1-like [Lineus longissimus]|uniref:microsomal glutathione S-transferase 1-like n=1 Tax=Lineus longissimus TaxID=88925 RepID=UPI002B4FB113